MSLPKNILTQSKTRLVLMPPFLGLAPGKARSTERGTEKHIPKGPCMPHWPDFVSRITMVIFSPNTNTVNIFIYMSLSALIAHQFKKGVLMGGSLPVNEIGWA